MKPARTVTPRRRPPPITRVEVEVATFVPPVDLGRWADRLVRAMLEAEGIRPAASNPEAA